MSKSEKLLVLFTWGLLTIPGFVFKKYCINPFFQSQSGILGLSPFGLFLCSLYLTFMFLALISHLRCWLSNPGWTPTLPVPVNDKNITQCTICDQYKPKRSHHCRSCKKCVHRLDHHCVWVNNCIGALNQKFFILFLGYTIATCATGLLIAISTMLQIYLVGKVKIDVLGIFLVVFCTAVAVLFFIYAGDFVLEQVESVKENQTCVESYQYKRGICEDPLKNFEDVFGKKFWFWLLPVSPDIRPNYLEGIVIMRQVDEDIHNRD